MPAQILISIYLSKGFFNTGILILQKSRIHFSRPAKVFHGIGSCVAHLYIYK